MATQGAYGPPGAELQRLYDADAVDRYVAQLQAHIEDLQVQVTEAGRVAQEAQHKALAVTNAEAMLGKALLSAQRVADETIADAERQAELMLADARREADRLLGDVRADAQRIVDEAHETVEAVFAALAAQRDREPPRQPEPEAVVFPPPPAPPSPVWAAPDPAYREPDEEDDDPSQAWGPASASWHDIEAEPIDAPSHGEGTIVDLRPGRTSSPHGTHARPPETTDTGWTLALGGTGTEGRPLPALAPRRDPVVTDARPVGADLLDRWRLARSGPSSLDDEFLSRQTQLDSLADGSYVSQLRGESPAPAGELTVERATMLARVHAGPPPADAAAAHPTPARWQPKPPPVGPPVARASRRFALLRRNR